MKIERISDSSIRVILNNDDLAKRSIDGKTLLEDSNAYERLIWDVVEHAEIELGVDILNGRVKVENVSTDNDSFSFTITDLTDHTQPAIPEEGKEERGESFISDDVPEGICDNVYLKRELENRADFLFSNGTGVIWFQNFNEMQTFFKTNPHFASLASALYQLNETFYITVRASKKTEKLIPLLDMLLADCNAAYLPYEIFKPILDEYATVIFRNGAIKKIINAM